MKPLTEDLGQKLKAAREKAGFTQREVALALEIQQPTYSQYEKNTRSPSLETFARLVKILGVSADFMLFGGQARDEILFDEEALQVFEEFKDLHTRNQRLFVDLLHVLKNHEAL